MPDIRKIRKALAKCVPLKATYHVLRPAAISAVCHVSPGLLTRIRHRIGWDRWPDLRNPTTFDEKVLWLNLYWRHPLKTECADKYTLRGYAERQGLGHLLPRIYGVYETAGAIDFAALPQRFVLKCSHGCHCNVFCRNKTELDLQRTRRDLTRWLATDYSKLLGELHYAGMKPRILCEEFLEDGTGELPTDYKLYCSRGRFHCTLVCTGRRPNENANEDFVDRDWKRLPYNAESLAAGRRIVRPAAYEEMISAAERLSEPFPFVRVDFYCIQGRAVLGEMTFTPSACIDTTVTELGTRALGDFIELPDKLL
jgi:TupA-like ATPgrasp